MLDLLPGGRRLSIRLSTHDYSGNSAYFLTICTYRRAPLFGSIFEGVMTLSPAGRIVRDLWVKTSEVGAGVILDAFIIMPNHMHAIIVLPTAVGQKSDSTSFRRAPGSAWLEQRHLRLWQRNYYERVIRDARAWGEMRRYIAANPARWRNPPVVGMDNPL